MDVSTVPAEMLERYKKALRLHVLYVNTICERYGNTDPTTWGNSDYLQISRRSAQLSGMAEVLGLTPEEEKVFEKEAGFIH